MSKRVKINIGSINKGNYKVIDPKKIAESRKRISKKMKEAYRDFAKKEKISRESAKKLIINK